GHGPASWRSTTASWSRPARPSSRVSKPSRALGVADDQALIAMLDHPLRREILRHAVERGKPRTPNQNANGLGRHLNNVAYHVRVLAGGGALTLVDEQPTSGALEHFYVHDEAVTSVDWVREVLGLPPAHGVGG